MRPSWGAVADAIGHCMLVFAFAPTLVALPGWLYFEATNPLNRHDPIVLAFLPVRGVKALLDAFAAGIVPGVLAGFLNGVIVSAWLAWNGDVSTPRRRIALGAGSGALAAVLMTLVLVSIQLGRGATVPVVAVAFEIASGTACGLIAVPSAIRLYRGRTRSSAFQ